MRTEHRATGLCIHCNRCVPTIYRGTRCVLVPEPAGAAVGPARPGGRGG
jgi:hypothetical protein